MKTFKTITLGALVACTIFAASSTLAVDKTKKDVLEWKIGYDTSKDTTNQDTGGGVIYPGTGH